MSIDEAIEVQPNSIFSILFEIFDDSRKLKRGRQRKIFEIFHEHGYIKTLSNLLVLIKCLVFHTHRLAIEIENNKEFLQYFYFIWLPFLLIVLLFGSLFRKGIINRVETYKKVNHCAVIFLRGASRALLMNIWDIKRFTASLLLFDQISDGFEKLIDATKLKLSPILLIYVFINGVVLSKLITF